LCVFFVLTQGIAFLFACRIVDELVDDDGEKVWSIGGEALGAMVGEGEGVGAMMTRDQGEVGGSGDGRGLWMKMTRLEAVECDDEP
jgi:hypothetical protein